MAGVGTQRIYEDDQVIVWQFELLPGEQGEFPTHHLDYAIRILSGSTVEVSGIDREVLYTVKREPGEMGTFRVTGEQIVSDFSQSTAIPTTHRVKNVGQTTFSEILIEFKAG